MTFKCLFAGSWIIALRINILPVASSTVQDSAHMSNTSKSSGCTDINLHEIDNRIALSLKNPEQNSANGPQILKDVFEYYNYLSKMMGSIDTENNYKLLKIVLSQPPQFIAVHYDDERLLKAFSWTKDQIEEFNRAFEGSFLLWQRLESMRRL